MYKLNTSSERRKAIVFPKQQQTLNVLGENIKLARKRRQLTQQLVSDRTGISRVTLRKIEKGEPTVSIGHYISVLGLAGDLGGVASDDELGRKLQDTKLLSGRG